MKKLILFFVFFVGMQAQIQAQNVPLNKEQTVDYISKLFKATYYFKDVKIDNLAVEGKTLNINLSSGERFRYDLSNISSLVYKKEDTDGQFYIYSSTETDKRKTILFHIQTEDDAKRLKKALEHLIGILKTEKNTDPFGE